ncbi:hypothetical protein FISHEDRAFT_52783 [Fistulina hepatica ATCC 64428]|nr:hypothetical protein FISHEDRAFT_52783 [Fistulina hepatica ATCC 64428]
MDVDADSQKPSSDIVYAKSDELSVFFYANLPIEVTHILKLSADQFIGSIDTQTGFAVLVSSQSCYVWQHAQAVKGIPTCYTFRCPRDEFIENSDLSPAYHALLPHGHGREPGLVLMSATGLVHFWENISIGLAGGEHYFKTSLSLADDEVVTSLIRGHNHSFIASTNAGNMFRLTVTSARSRLQLSVQPFIRPTTSRLSRFLPSLFASSSAESVRAAPGYISAVVLGVQSPSGGQYVWALIDSRIQRWDVLLDSEELSLDVDISMTVTSRLHSEFGSRAHDPLLLDLAMQSDGRLIILTSYSDTKDDLQDKYALIQVAHVGDTFRVEAARAVPYQGNFGDGPSPRIQLIDDGLLVSVQFSDAFAICARDSDYRDRLELKDPDARVFGAGVLDSTSGLASPTTLVLTSSSMLRIVLDPARVKKYDPHSGQTKLIKSVMTQAIVYGSVSHNPLRFRFPPGFDVDGLIRGAQQLSHAVLVSDRQIIRQNHDLGAQMQGRKERLSWLISFINENGALDKMPQSARQSLAMDAEQLYAGYRLWLQHNEFLDTSPQFSVLHEAVLHCMEDIDATGVHDDPMRDFFRYCIPQLGMLLGRIVHVVVVASQHMGQDLVWLLPEANRIVLTVLQSAMEFRKYNAEVYGLQKPMLEAWTSQPDVLGVLEGLFETAHRALSERVMMDTDIDNTSASTELRAQLPDLVATLFECMQERLDSAPGKESQNAEQERLDLDTKFKHSRPVMLEILRQHNHVERAFALGEQWQDFGALVALCHRETVYPVNANPHAERISLYVEKFKDKFAMELYKWYIHNGELRALFALDKNGPGRYIDGYFELNPEPSISWLRDLEQRRYDEAADSMLDGSSAATTLDAQLVMLSVGKLAKLAGHRERAAHGARAANAWDPGLWDAYNDALDFIGVQQTLAADFRSINEGSGRSMENQLRIIVEARAARLSSTPILETIFKSISRQLLSGTPLSTEDVVDLLTLQDNAEPAERSRFATALDLLASVESKPIPGEYRVINSHAKTMPEARRMSAFRTVWRRIYINDDWDSIRLTADVSDAELTARFRRTALYTTLRALLIRDNSDRVPVGYITVPDEAKVIPSEEEIESRWPGMAPDEVHALMHDYELESHTLVEWNPNDVYERICELAEEDARLAYGTTPMEP